MDYKEVMQALLQGVELSEQHTTLLLGSIALGVFFLVFLIIKHIFFAIVGCFCGCCGKRGDVDVDDDAPITDNNRPTNSGSQYDNQNAAGRKGEGEEGGEGEGKKKGGEGGDMNTPTGSAPSSPSRQPSASPSSPSPSSSSSLPYASFPSSPLAITNTSSPASPPGSSGTPSMTVQTPAKSTPPSSSSSHTPGRSSSSSPFKQYLDSVDKSMLEEGQSFIAHFRVKPAGTT